MVICLTIAGRLLATSSAWIYGVLALAVFEKSKGRQSPMHAAMAMRIYATAFTVLLILLIPVAAEEITACTEINQSGVYHLANDISENATMCIII
ncbi:hypothetical protein DRP04_13305, partial [Archaeoglobales archaeon]